MDNTYKANFQIVNANKSFKNLAVQNFRMKPPKWVKAIADAIPRSLVDFVIKGVEMINYKHEKRYPMSDDLRKKLLKEFRPDIETLSNLIDRDLTHWCDN